jgi:hypothetical protein
MIMNEHIQELITAYLHRGSSPEQEQELFDACRRDPEIAEQLRQHLILSLKLRSLRDDVTVEPALHDAVKRRIAAADDAAHAGVVPDMESRHAAAPAPPPRRFRLVHLFGTGVATAAAAAALVLLLLPDSAPLSRREAMPVANLADTVYIVKKDTVTQLREVTRTVYVAEAEKRSAPADAAIVDADAQIAEHRLPPEQHENAPSRQSTEAATPPSDNERAEASAPPADKAADAEDTFFAEARPIEERSMRDRTQNYLEQYNAMLVTVASVRLTDADRIAH